MHAAIDLIPHRPPFLLVDRVIAVEDDRVDAEKLVTAGDPLVGDGGLGGPLLMEACAQTAACLMGALGGGEGHLGYLVAAQGWKFLDFARPGEIARFSARRVSMLGALHRFEAVARVGERELASGTMTFAVRFDGAAPGA
jgi:3-hydroxyacyl-[acyl-carrier-protein] dehydratase